MAIDCRFFGLGSGGGTVNFSTPANFMPDSCPNGFTTAEQVAMDGLRGSQLIHN
ncbi:hypothetical protein [Lyngbya sp. CCY1209]|uniref:hypothetical protein n=1 Tax=Lyngbya sp. CCY1209 TaxID=2886103 RepID=UPI002D20DAF2|nr:hypothetical protein [Lyngbya sp. CCY1209]MEB3886102.1 hypothetical protein [Lyngbya sp. CCY1209]